jgi:phosphopantothenoylcysteine decarboxylase / phosphopantothenate---cysteine ligase
VLVTAGGTREPIDAVRYIANRSSGRQGHALADEAAARGAEVLLVTASALAGPAGSEVVRVSTAAEMEVAVLARSAGCDAVVMAAAVADFRPKAPAEGKLAKADGVPDIVLEPTPDIVAEVVRRRPPGQVVVCFAAEATGGGGELRRRAAAKLAAKGADLIVANDITRPGAGFESETNEVVIIDRAGGEVVVPMASKRAVASVVVDQVVAALAVGTRTPE